MQHNLLEICLRTREKLISVCTTRPYTGILLMIDKKRDFVCCKSHVLIKQQSHCFLRITKNENACVFSFPIHLPYLRFLSNLLTRNKRE